MASASMVPAALYMRMSTAHQQYSLENQSAAIGQYAKNHQFHIVATYSDAARSGITLKNRSGFRQLLQDVSSRDVPFKAILVYDVSRWGRFQDVDESAYYEFLCKSAGIPVHFCAEQFQNDCTTPNMIMKALKRTMAGEYSRELGVKVLSGQKRPASLGFKQGGPPGYGLRRMQVSTDRTCKQVLEAGQRKNVLSDKVILVPGPVHEVEIVREIYRMLIADGRTIHWIACELNRRKVPYLGGRPWTHSTVEVLLTHPKYAGSSVFNLTTRRLGSPRTISTEKSEWVVVPGAYEPIIDHATFDQAQKILQNRTIRKSNDDLLDGLRKLLAEKGKLTTVLIDRSPDMPSVNAIIRRFGGLLKVYKLIGYKAPAQDEACMMSRAQTLIMREDLVARLLRMFHEELVMVRRNNRWRAQFRLQDGPTFSLQVAKLQPRSRYTERWRIIPNEYERNNLTLLARLNPTNDAFHDFYILPSNDRRQNFHIRENDLWLDRGKRLPDLSQLPKVLRQVEQMKASSGHQNNRQIVAGRPSGMKGSCCV